MRVLSLALLVAALGACLSVPRAYPVPQGAYGEALRAATREVVVRRGFDAAVIAYATYDTPAFREARAARLSTFFSIPAPEAVARVGALAQGGPGPSFIVSVYTGARLLNELDRSSALVNFRLKAGSGSFAPTQIVRLPHSPSVEALYPYADVFFATYRLNFGAEAATARPVLALTGPAGEAAFSFE